MATGALTSVQPSDKWPCLHRGPARSCSSHGPVIRQKCVPLSVTACIWKPSNFCFMPFTPEGCIRFSMTNPCNSSCKPHASYVEVYTIQLNCEITCAWSTPRQCPGFMSCYHWLRGHTLRHLPVITNADSANRFSTCPRMSPQPRWMPPHAPGWLKSTSDSAQWSTKCVLC